MTSSDDAVQHSAPGFLMSRGTRLFARLADKSLIPLGTRYADAPVLLQLRRDGPSPQRDLLREAAVGQPAMVATIARLEVAGLVERRPHGVDRRATAIALTAEGERIADASLAALQEVNGQALDGFSADERQAALNLLQRMIGNMGGLSD